MRLAVGGVIVNGIEQRDGFGSGGKAFTSVASTSQPLAFIEKIKTTCLAHAAALVPDDWTPLPHGGSWKLRDLLGIIGVFNSVLLFCQRTNNTTG